VSDTKNRTKVDAIQKTGSASRLEKLFADQKAVSISVVLLGFICGTLLILLVGRNPAGMYSAKLQNPTGFDITGDPGTPVHRRMLTRAFFDPLRLAMGSRANRAFQYRPEGQYIVGLTAAQFIALYFPPVPGLHWIVAIAAAGLAGALWGGIVGWLKAKFAVSEVVATIMLNYIAFFFSRWSSMLIPGSNTYKTPNFPDTARLSSPLLEQLTNGSRLNLGLWIALLSCVVLLVRDRENAVGFELRATGLNRDAARYAGIRVTRSITTSMLMAGMFAGFAGAAVALGSFSYGRVLGGYDNYGFNGIAVALVGNNSAGGTLISGLLFGMLASAQPLMQSRQIPKEITLIISGLVVVFISLRSGVKLFLDWKAKKVAQTQKAALDE